MPRYTSNCFVQSSPDGEASPSSSSPRESVTKETQINSFELKDQLFQKICGRGVLTSVPSENFVIINGEVKVTNADLRALTGV